MFAKISIVLPVHNEEKILKESLERLISFLNDRILNKWNIIISENGSEDHTEKIAQDLTLNHNNITLIRSEVPGRGGAIKRAWESCNT
ncbi:uncharacterized protein METZ01_LOCUS441618, partial [marine metagenome]